MKTKTLTPHQLDQYYTKQAKVNNLIINLLVLALVAGIFIAGIVLSNNYQAY